MTSGISNSIKLIGVNDCDLKLFEGQYPLNHGMAYNSYLILDEKIAVTDTVDAAWGDLWLQNLETALNGAKPDYLIVHHMEPDHSANIARFMQLYPSATLVASAKAIAMLPLYFENADFLNRTLAVKEGDTLPLGHHTLHFFAAPMVHWPEVLVSYDDADAVLFSADAFGKFGATSYDEEWTAEARRYYVNIVGKYGPQVQMALKKLAGVEIKAIAPLHGPVLTDNLATYLDLYGKWSTYTPEQPDGVLVAYASVYGGTAQAALKLAEMLREKGASVVETIDLCRNDVSEAVAQAFRLGKIVLASPTYDAGIFPAMHDFIYHLQIKALKNRRFALIENGSWAPIAAKVMKEMLAELKNTEIVEPTVTIRGKMHEADIAALTQLADALLG